MNKLIVALNLALVFIISGCASASKEVSYSHAEMSPLMADAKRNKERIKALATIAKKEKYEVIQTDEGIRVIMPSHKSFHPKRNLLLPSSLNSLGKLAKEISEDGSLQVLVLAHGNDTQISLKQSRERTMAIVSVLRLAGIGRHQIESMNSLSYVENEDSGHHELFLFHGNQNLQAYTQTIY